MEWDPSFVPKMMILESTLLTINFSPLSMFLNISPAFIMVFPLLRIVSSTLGMIVASCRKVFDERNNPDHGFRLRTNLFLASFRSQRTTPLWPAGTIAKEPHEIMKRIKRTIRIKMVWGFGPLKSNASNDLSAIVHLLWVSKHDRMASISVPLLPPLSELPFPPDTKFGSGPEGQIVTFTHQNVAFRRALRGLPFWGLFSLKEKRFLLGINFDFSL